MTFKITTANLEFSDPFRWMEDDSLELPAWVQEHHEFTIAQLSSLPVREQIHQRLAEVMQTPTVRTVARIGRRHFYRERRLDQELSALYCKDDSHGTIRLLLDPNELSPDHSITLSHVYPSPDSSLIACRLSTAGNSCMSLRIIKVDSAEMVDEIPGDVNPVAHVWHTPNRVAWLPDSGGFYYTRCPNNTPANERRFNQKLYLHQVGADWRNDKLVFGESLQQEQSPYPLISADGRYLVVVVQDFSGASPRSEVYILDREEDRLASVVLNADAFVHAALHRDRLYLRTNYEAPLGKIIALKLADLAGEASEVIPEGRYPLRAWTMMCDYLFVETIEDVSSRLRVFDLDGNFLKEIELPDIGSINGLSASTGTDELLFSFSSFVRPRAEYRLDLRTLSYRLVQQDEVKFDPDKFVVEQVWFKSRDQTSIPMFLVHQHGIELAGANPTVLYGYGGFGVSLLPVFTAHVIPFLENGGVYAIVNARGGGEFGESWHRAGVRELKRHTFDDVIAAAEWLIAQGYTQSSQLGCFGWSNGGLTMNAVAVQRPDLWRAVVVGAAVTDLARFHLANGGRNWIADYGSPEDPAELEFLLRHSPYHSLPEKIAAPAILSIAPGNDDRVAPWHGYKMHAAWRAANVSDRPVLLRGEDDAGHRGGPTTSKSIDLYADIWAFFFWQLGIARSSNGETE
ncbi:MAG TPA: prolyl oligopeptidase family serine peptidase [Pyrinomonadaceae bacterium]